MRLRALALALLASATSALAQTDSVKASGSTRLQLSLLRLMGYTATLPEAKDFTSGNRTIAKDSVVKGAVGVVDGSLDVFGTIEGPAMVIDGNLRVHPGASISGDAITVRGRIINQGGVIKGETAGEGDFVANGGWKGVKEKGVMRQEGKDYVVQDGDVLLFRFNV
jgi:hypothetical protein